MRLYLPPFEGRGWGEVEGLPEPLPGPEPFLAEVSGGALTKDQPRVSERRAVPDEEFMSAEIKCPRCGNAVSKSHAFCPKCGAVVTPEGSAPPPPPKRNDSAEFAATIVGQKFPLPTPPTPPRPAEPPQQPQPQPQQARPAGGAPAATPPAAPAQSYQQPALNPTARSGSPVLFIVVGFIVVLVIGGLLAFLLYSFFLR